MDKKAQRVAKGLAPFASLEDLSDESPPDDKCRLTLPGIKEDPTTPGQKTVAGITPRIDISRASSSSHHEDSSPERELFGAGGGEGGNGVKYGLGFTEEMAQELRSSTEELDFHDPTETETKTRRKKLQQQHAVSKYDLETQSEHEYKDGRKDSACSEGGLLYIGGRTSRLSSIGSAASGGSVASHVSGGSGISAHSHISNASHISGASHLSAVSNYSRASRCSSPHRMMLETSFCGPKPIPTVSLDAEFPPKEAALLARATDTTDAILPEESLTTAQSPSAKLYSGKTTLEVKRSEVKIKPRSSSEKSPKTTSTTAQARSSSARSSRPRPKGNENDLVRIIPLHGSIDEPDPEPEPEPEIELQSERASPPEHGIYIPLKGPEIIQDLSKPAAKPSAPKAPQIEESDLVQFISLHGENDEEIERKRRSQGIGAQSRHRSDPSRSRPQPRKKPEPEGSGDSKHKKETKNKSVFTSIFKKTTKDKEVKQSQAKAPEKSLDQKLTNVEFKFKQEERKFEGDSIIIPLHSPDSIIEPLELLPPDPPEEKEPPTKLTTLQSVVAEVVHVERKVVVAEVLPPQKPRQMSLEEFEQEPRVIRAEREVEEKEEIFVSLEDVQEEKPQEEIQEEKVEEVCLPQPQQQQQRSSESEGDSESGVVKSEFVDGDETEKKGLCHQTDSVEEELPYVPTTLPQERSVALPIIPVKQRVQEVKTYPIDRPRSTTPINPSMLDEFAASHDSDGTAVSTPSEKMQITLPR